MKLIAFGVAAAAGAVFISLSPQVDDEQGYLLGVAIMAASACITIGVGLVVAS